MQRDLHVMSMYAGIACPSIFMYAEIFALSLCGSNERVPLPCGGSTDDRVPAAGGGVSAGVLPASGGDDRARIHADRRPASGGFGRATSGDERPPNSSSSSKRLRASIISRTKVGMDTGGRVVSFETQTEVL